jgi:hypothetical protein
VSFCIAFRSWVVGIIISGRLGRLALCSPGHQGDDLICKEVAALVSLGP